MPWTGKQHRLFEAAAHDPKVAARTGIKRSDARRMAREGVKRTRRDDVESAFDKHAAEDAKK